MLEAAGSKQHSKAPAVWQVAKWQAEVTRESAQVSAFALTCSASRPTELRRILQYKLKPAHTLSILDWLCEVLRLDWMASAVARERVTRVVSRKCLPSVGCRQPATRQDYCCLVSCFLASGDTGVCSGGSCLFTPCR